MITMAFDESGSFEKTVQRQKKEPVFIAGLLYDDRGKKADAANERRRIAAYYQRICLKARGHFPEDLHVNKNNSNDALVAKVKNLVQSSLKEFLCHGTYEKKSLMFAEKRRAVLLIRPIKESFRQAELI